MGDDPPPQTNGNSSDNDHQAEKDKAEKDKAEKDKIENDQAEKDIVENDHQAENNHKENKDIEKELQKRLENIPETSREMEAAQTEALNVLGEVSKVLQPKDAVK